MKKLTVLSCRECPFMRDLPILGDLTRLLAGDVKSGHCAYDRENNVVVTPPNITKPGPERDKQKAAWKNVIGIEDRDQIPEKCPLRTEPVTVSLGS